MGLLNADLVNVSFRGICFGQQIILSRMYTIVGDFPVGTSVATDLGSILTQLLPGGLNDVATPYLACLPATYTLQQVQAQRWKPTRSAYVPNALVGFVGTNVGAASVANDAAAITFRTALAGRSHTGTAHIGPVPDTASVAGLLTAAYTALLGTLGQALLNSFSPPTSGSVVAPVLWNRATNTIDFLQNFIVQSTSRVQRRRTVGVGK